ENGPPKAPGAEGGGAGELFFVDVVAFHPAGIAVAHQQIGFAGHAAEIADARELPVQADRAHEGRAGDLVRLGLDFIVVTPPASRAAQAALSDMGNNGSPTRAERPREAPMREIGHFIGGKKVAGTSGRGGDVFNPNTGE